MVDGARVLLEAFAAGIEPDPTVTVSQWADRARVLTTREAAEPGPWRTSRTPYLREIMDALSESSPVERVVLQKGAQLGGTEAILNWIGYTVAHAPGPFLYALPTLDVARRFSRLRVEPMLESSPELRGKVSDPRSRDATNTVLSKEFEGGFLTLVGVNSAASLRGMPARKIAMDELDAWPADVEEEGDPVALLERRAATFGRPKLLLVSTPGIEGRSRIAAEFERGDQRNYFVPCPECANLAPIEWQNLKWEEGKPETVRLSCTACGFLIPEHAKEGMLAGGVWIPTLSERSDRFRSYRLSSLYSPLGMYSWTRAVEDWLKAQKDQQRLKTFVNTVLAETWKERGDAPEWARLYERREPYKIGTVPRGGLLLTAGVDVQKDRLELEVVAWGKGRESWSVDYIVIPGEPAGPAPWRELEKVLVRGFPHESGALLRLRGLAVDTGYETQAVYGWARTQHLGLVFAVKGTDGHASLIEAPKAVEVARAGKRIQRGLRVWGVSGPVAKAELYSWLRLPRPLEPKDPYPPGFVHFPEYGREFFEQLVAEHVVVRLVRGYRRYQWEKKRERNEALDCRVYARAALAILGGDRWGDAEWLQIENSLGSGIGPVAPAAKPRERRPGYFDRWRGT